jgi:hypothetical protein
VSPYCRQRVNNTCGGERLSDYPQQALQGTCGAERPLGLHSNHLSGPSTEIVGKENPSPVEVKTFRISTASPCREPVELKDLQASTAFPKVFLQRKLKKEKKPSLNNTCGRERRLSYPQQLL